MIKKTDRLRTSSLSSSGGEFRTINTENSIIIVDQMIWNYWWLCPMRELIMDHGTEFGGNRILENGNSNSIFQNYIKEIGIKPIMARVKHPKTNGKLEKWFDTFRRFRQDFDLLREFIDWYNDRPHGSLDFDRLRPQIRRSCEKCLKKRSLESDTGYLGCENHE